MRAPWRFAIVVVVVACGPSSKGTGAGADGNGPPEVHTYVDPTLPPNIGDEFEGLTLGPGLSLVYPNSGAVIPRDVGSIDVQGAMVAGLEVYRVRFASDDGNELRGYVPQASWLPDDANWMWLMGRAAGHTLSLSIAGAHFTNGQLSGPGMVSASQPLVVSRDAATGALFYFATTGD